MYLSRRNDRYRPRGIRNFLSVAGKICSVSFAARKRSLLSGQCSSENRRLLRKVRSRVAERLDVLAAACRQRYTSANFIFADSESIKGNSDADPDAIDLVNHSTTAGAVPRNEWIVVLWCKRSAVAPAGQ